MRVRSQIKGAVLGGVRATAGLAGHDVVERHFYSPIPDAAALPESRWQGPLEVPGVDLRVASAAEFMRTELRPFLESFRPRAHANGERGFYLENESYESVDAELLYAILRHLKPQLVLELGSGATSHVIQEAATANDEDGRPLAHEIFDPYPFEANPMGPVAGPLVHRQRAEDIRIEEIARLRGGDVLFVDTTHTVKTGGDVTRIILEFLPLLASGVWVHVHDIFLPYEYPRQWVKEQRRAWAEQYLLQAFLAFNASFEVMMPAQAISRAEPELVAELIPSFTADVSPGAFWLRRL